jgi:hypothetical protein
VKTVTTDLNVELLARCHARRNLSGGVAERRDGGGIRPVPPPGGTSRNVRPMGGRWIRRRVLAVTAAGLAGACWSGGADAAFTLDELRTAGDTCPVDLASTSLAPDDGGEVEVDVVEGTAPGGQVSGVYVECTLPVDGGGDVTAVVFASEQPGAISLVLPHAQRHLRLVADDLEGVLAAFDDTDAGELVDLGAEGPVAIAHLDVDGAESAVLYVSAPSAAPDDVRDATEGILDDL